MKKIYMLLLFVMASVVAFTQDATLSGTVNTEEGPSIGSIVRLQGTTYGAVTDVNGAFTISGITPGDYTLEISSVGFDNFVQQVSLTDGATVNIGEITLSGGSLALEGVEIIADIAIDRKTPVALSNLSGEYVESQIGNQEIGELLTVTPSVYASRQGGGSGDSRIVVRGFDQRNTVYMINGIPVNDMENGWVYWSNWAGVADVARTVQVQRGLGASMLANPSIGGTVNLITKTTDMEAGGHFFGTIGNDLYTKYGLTLSTGNLNGWTMTFSGSRTTGNGYVAGTFNDAYSYFGSIAKDFKKMSFVLTGLGAPQRHGQRTFAYGLTQYVPNGGTDYAKFVNGSSASDFNSRDISNSIRWNSSWGYSDMAPILGARENDYINERTNFYHKPQVSLNQYWNVSEKFYLANSLYGSWGRGGGTGPYGTIGTYRSAYRTGGPEDLIDWNSVEAANSQVTNGIGKYGTGEDFYLLRASMNEHDWYGLLSKGIFEIDDVNTVTAGIDWRSYKGIHYRKIVNLFGLQGFDETDFADYPDGKIVGVDDKVFGISNEYNKIDYDNDGLVDWLGGYLDYEYSTDALTFTVAGSYSNKSYQRVDRQNYAENDPNRTSGKFDFGGYAVKGGASYNINDNNFVFGNAGILSIAPIFDIVFPRYNNVDVNPDANNEKTLSYELGYGYRTNKLGINLNGYYTNWIDKAFVKRFSNQTTGELFYANLAGVEATHKGIELDASWKPIEKIRFDLMSAFNDWKWGNNVSTDVFDDDNNFVSTENIFIKDLKVGNAPQKQFSGRLNWDATSKLSLNATYRYFSDYYADFDPLDRNDPTTEGVQAAKIPSYGVLDLGLGFKVPVKTDNEFYVRGNLYNVLDKLYISDAFDRVNSPLQDLSGYFAPGRTWTATAGFRFTQSKPEKEVVEVPMPAEPVDLDADDDGVIDDVDKCPNTPGTVNGCPDQDGDGVIDENDDCPEEPGLAENNGCPEDEEEEVIIEEVNVDTDGDGVIDEKDNCPDVVGDVGNYGCPAPEVVEVDTPSQQVVDQLNFIARSIFFQFDSDRLLEDSKTQLDAISNIMKDYPDAQFIIEGHTDSKGNDAYNKQLSSRRANSVRNYLIKRGIPATHLDAIGYGEENPIASNDTEEGRRQNRRVVIKVK